MKKLLFVLLGLFLLVPALASAATLKSATKNEAGISVAQNEKVKNAYLAGSAVSFSGESEEDVIAVGNTLNFTGKIGESLMAAGNSLNLTGPVGSSARVAGNTVNVQSEVGADFFGAGQTLTLDENAVISDDFFAGAAFINLLGKVGGNAQLAGGQIYINGEVKGDLNIKGANKVTLGDKAIINGNFIYKATEKASISPQAKILGVTTFTQTKAVKPVWSKQFFALITVFSLLMLLGTLLIIWLLAYLFPKFFREILESSTKKPILDMAIGFAYLVVVPIAAIIIMVTVIGLPLGFLVLGLYALALGFTKLIVPVFVGGYLFKWLGKDKTFAINWLAILVGVVVTAIVGSIPFIGGLAMFLVFLLVLAQLAKKITGYLGSQR